METQLRVPVPSWMGGSSHWRLLMGAPRYNRERWVMGAVLGVLGAGASACTRASDDGNI